MREQRVILKNHADTTLVGRDIIYRHAIQQYIAMGCSFKSGKHHQTGGFARTGRSQHCQEFSFGQFQIQVFYNQRFSIITFLYPVKFDKGIFGGIIGTRDHFLSLPENSHIDRTASVNHRINFTGNRCNVFFVLIADLNK